MFSLDWFIVIDSEWFLLFPPFHSLPSLPSFPLYFLSSPFPSLPLPLSIPPSFPSQLVLTGIIDTGIGTSLLMDMLSAVTKVDQAGGHPYLPVIVGFARHCAEDVAGIVPRKQRLLLDKYGIKPPVSEVSPCH